MEDEPTNEVPRFLKNRIDKNHQKAIDLKQGRLVSHPYAKNEQAVIIEKTTVKIGDQRYKDTGGGFLLCEEEEEELKKLVNEGVFNEPLPPVLDPHRPICVKCEKPFSVSWLFDNFCYKCCDECRDEEEHKLITKTDALKTYLLRDYDLDKREPPLQFITRKNPHNTKWGQMKLFLEIQVKERALKVWENEDKIEEEKVKREEKRVIAKHKKYKKELKQLRMNMRSSLYDRTTKASHVHNFGPETYDEENDMYRKNCLECPYVEEYEKL